MTLMNRLRGLSDHKVYGQHIQSVLSSTTSSNDQMAESSKLEMFGNQKGDKQRDDTPRDDMRKTIDFQEHSFWKSINWISRELEAVID